VNEVADQADLDQLVANQELSLCGCKATWKREFKLPWREAGQPNHHDVTVDSDQRVVNQELSLCRPQKIKVRA
jgi:hypothetical protein